MEHNVENPKFVSGFDVESLRTLVPEAGTLLIVPPFLRLNVAHLGVHLLQACGQNAGHPVAILYANILFAQEIGEDLYHAVAFSAEQHLMGDRVFANAAYQTPLLGKGAKEQFRDYQEAVSLENEGSLILDYSLLCQVAAHAEQFTQRLAETIITIGFDVVGCTSMFNQNTASVAILNRVKQMAPHTTTILGGANCAGEMAEGIATLSGHIDHIFSGESEEVFIKFLNDRKQGIQPESRIINGEMRMDLDSLPTPDFSDYFHQLRSSQLDIDENRIIHLTYESSRGCWWGQKHHCTFCSLFEMRYRMKSPDRVIEELKQVLKQSPSKRISFSDDIMPFQYFKTLLPRLKKEVPDLKFFIDQKANLSLKKVRALADAGAYALLPGIEALSSSLLEKMDKGTTARQNIMLMRYARANSIYLFWYMLHGFPGDTEKDYADYKTLIPLLFHLNPPRFYQEIQIMRHGMYVLAPEKYGVTNLRPWQAYYDILPETSDHEKVAFYFDGDYSAITRDKPELVKEIGELAAEWRNQWARPVDQVPALYVNPIERDRYLLIDSRNLKGTASFQFLTQEQAAAALVGFPLNQMPSDWEIKWGVENKVCIELDDWVVPLATATPDLMARFEAHYHPKRASSVSQLVPQQSSPSVIYEAVAS